MDTIITVILLIVLWIFATKPSGERKGCLLLLFFALFGLFMLFYSLGKRDMEEHSYSDYQYPSYLDTGTYVIDKPALTDEEQYIISELEIEHGVNIGMYEMMDHNFPPKDAVKWEDGRYYHKSDIEKYYVHMGKTGATDKPCVGCKSLTQKHVAKRYMIAEKLLPLHHES